MQESEITAESIKRPTCNTATEDVVLTVLQGFLCTHWFLINNNNVRVLPWKLSCCQLFGLYNALELLKMFWSAHVGNYPTWPPLESNHTNTILQIIQVKSNLYLQLYKNIRFEQNEKTCRKKRNKTLWMKLLNSNLFDKELRSRREKLSKAVKIISTYAPNTGVWVFTITSSRCCGDVSQTSISRFISQQPVPPAILGMVIWRLLLPSPPSLKGLIWMT